jgi:hypothetical protein
VLKRSLAIPFPKMTDRLLTKRAILLVFTFVLSIASLATLISAASSSAYPCGIYRLQMFNTQATNVSGYIAITANASVFQDDSMLNVEYGYNYLCQEITPTHASAELPPITVFSCTRTVELYLFGLVYPVNFTLTNAYGRIYGNAAWQLPFPFPVGYSSMVHTPCDPSTDTICNARLSSLQQYMANRGQAFNFDFNTACGTPPAPSDATTNEALKQRPSIAILVFILLFSLGWFGAV